MSTSTRQRRTLATAADFEIRAIGDGRVGIRGYAAVFDQIAYGEVVRSGAFDKTLAERDDVRLLVNHEGVAVARTKSGTLSLSVDDRGLVAEAPDLDLANPTVAELVSAMNRGDIDQMSFAFTPILIGQIEDPATGEVIDEVIECRLWDVSVVTFPWYDETSVDLELSRALRALHDGRTLTDEQRQLVLDRAGETPAPDPEPEVTAPAARRLDLADRLWSPS